MTNVKFHRVSRLGLRNNTNANIVVPRLGLGRIKDDLFEDEISRNIVLFFRSIDQANGMPKKSNTKPKIIYNDARYPDFDTDNTYNQSFGFDVYREDLYGKNSKLYIFKDSTTEDSGKVLENLYKINSNLSLKLKKKNGRDYYITNEFKLKRGVNYTSNDVYYIPNLMISQNKEIVIYAKHFSADNEDIKASISFSHEKGIQSYTKELLFTRRKSVLPIKIKTKSSEAIDTPIKVSISIENENSSKIIGNLTILPNETKIANYLFINVYYNTTTKNPINSVKLTKELNEKAFGQAAISIKNCNNSFSLNLSPDSGVMDNEGVINTKLSSLFVNNNETDKIGKILPILEYEFYKVLASKILLKIEGKFKILQVRGSDNYTDFKNHLLLEKTETLENVLKLENDNDYYNVLNSIINFINNMDINLFPAFMCENITTQIRSKDTAVGYFNSRGLIIPKNALKNTMVIAHEIGHNLNLGHLFNKTSTKEHYDLNLVVTQTGENIMDYVPDTNRNSFITFQWHKMREALSFKEKNTEIDISDTQQNAFFYLKGEKSNRIFFSKNIFNALNDYTELKKSYHLELEIKDQKKILKTISESIQETFNELC